MRALVLGILLAPVALAAGPFDKDVYFANAGAVTELCRSAMTPPDADAAATQEMAGLCDCAMSGLLALNPMERNAPFLAVWADVASWRAGGDPSDLNAANAAIDGAVYARYRDMQKGKAEMRHYGDMAVTLTQVCSDGFAASGRAPPEFSAFAFQDGFSRKPD